MYIQRKVGTHHTATLSAEPHGLPPAQAFTVHEAISWMRRQTGMIFVLCVVCPFPVQRACPHYTIFYDTAGTSLKRTSPYQSFSSERLVLPVFLYTSRYYVHSNLAASGNGISCCWQSSISCGRHHLSISRRGQCTSPDSMECAKSPVTVLHAQSGSEI